MRVYKNTDVVSINKPVATIGMFDGVHQGHKEILSLLKKKADEINGETVVISFWPHPRMIFEGNNSLRLLTTMDEKVYLLNKEQIKHFVILPFNRDFANIPYQEFVSDILVNKLKIHTLIVGYNHQFGKNREGNFDRLKDLSKKFNFNVQKLDPHLVNQEKVSSSIIRESLEIGNIDQANDYLGYDFNFTGFVVEGKRKGRGIGFPTANLFIREPYKLIPGTGVYAVKVKLAGEIYQGMMNIGYRPTIVEDNKQKSIEVNIFNINKDLYGKELTIFVLEKTRDEIKFGTIQELITQLHKDEEIIKKILNK